MSKETKETIENATYIALNDKKYEIVFKTEEEEVLINKKRQNIILLESDDGFTYLLWQNKKYPAEIIEKNQNKYHILINGVSYTFSIETPISYKRKKYLKKHSKDSKIECVTAPMPGKIVDVLIDVNAEVSAGDPILVLEAMKMQNEIVANVSGRISKINIKQEDTVLKDDILVEIHK
ncbi:MAG: acetyl-CoA carboxylase biotin carboxyl carrier protein subunit [Bacteroidales bacterium]|nr:acetyl-CoA carboxylase biotin carboxyl carrier protein subunit [Bacteroidales bacterium]